MLEFKLLTSAVASVTLAGLVAAATTVEVATSVVLVAFTGSVGSAALISRLASPNFWCGLRPSRYGASPIHSERETNL